MVDNHPTENSVYHPMHHTARIINYILLINFSLVFFSAVYYAKRFLSAAKSNETNNSYFSLSLLKHIIYSVSECL